MFPNEFIKILMLINQLPAKSQAEQFMKTEKLVVQIFFRKTRDFSETYYLESLMMSHWKHFEHD